MIDLSCIKEAQDEMIYNMEQFFDTLYFKQQDILDSIVTDNKTYDDIMFEYACFQEGVVPPKLSDDLDMYKFDNKHLMKAIKHFDKMIKEFPDNEDVRKRASYWYNKTFRSKKEYEEDPKDKQKKLPQDLTDEMYDEYFKEVEKLIKEPNSEFKKGIGEIEKQFDCVVDLDRMGINNDDKKKKRNEGIFGTVPLLNASQLRSTNLTISKSKGFQLNGLKIILTFDVRAIAIFTFSNNDSGGARLCSVILHEIFHNIAHMMNVANSNFIRDSKDILNSTKADDTLASVTAKMSNFLDKVMKTFDMPKIKAKEKKRAIQRLYIASKIKNNPSALKKFKKDIENDEDPDTKSREDLEAYIERMEKSTHFTKIGSIFVAIGTVVDIILAAVCITSGTAVGVAVGVAASIALFFTFALKIIRFLVMKLSSVLIGKMDIKEEYYCDMFAAMYQLPVSFNSYKQFIKLNEAGNKDLVERYVSGKRDIHDALHDEHPASFDRDQCSYNIAKQILASYKKLKPEVRKYLEGIVADNEGIEDLKGNMSKQREKTLSPEAAKDLNRYLREFADKTGTTITEAFIEYFVGGIINA